MASVNKVILVGNLGRDPEVRYSPDGLVVANVSVATTSVWKDKNTGERREDTEWHRVVFYGRQAEIVGQYLKKGSAAYIEGRLKTRKWQDKEGVDRYTTEIVADQMQMLGGRGDTSGGDDAFGAEGGSNFSARNQGQGAARAQSEDGFSQARKSFNVPPAGAAPQTAQAPRPAAPQASTNLEDMDDDIPF